MAIRERYGSAKAVENGPKEPEELAGTDESNDSGNGPRVAQVPIESVVIGETPRLAGVSPEHVHVLGKAGTPLPPILVERSTMRLIDGMHRLHAAIASGEKSIEVEFFDGPGRAAYVESVRANIAHGLPLSLADRRAAAEKIIKLYPEWSDRLVAAAAGLSDKTIGSIRRCSTSGSPQPNIRIGRDGRARPVNSAVGRWIAGELLEERPHASLREIARESGISVATVRDVRDRLRRGEGPVPTVLGRGTAERRNGRSAAAVSPPKTGTRVVGASGTGGEPDGSSLLEGLKRDPSLRYNEAGRALLRWLDLRTVRTKEVASATERVPPHAVVIVARVARRCSVLWESLATDLELRTHDRFEAL